MFFIAVLLIPILGLFALHAEAGFVPFIPAFAFSVVALLVFNMFDLTVLDWLSALAIARDPIIVRRLIENNHQLLD